MEVAQQPDEGQPSPDDPDLVEKLMLAINTPPLYHPLVRHCASCLRGSEFEGEDGVGAMTLRVARRVGLYTTYVTCGGTDPLPRLAFRDARRTCSWLLRRSVHHKELTGDGDGVPDRGIDAVLDVAWLEAQLEGIADLLGISTEVPMLILRGLVLRVGDEVTIDELRVALELITGERWNPGQVRTRLSRMRKRLQDELPEIAEALDLDLPIDEEYEEEGDAHDER